VFMVACNPPIFRSWQPVADNVIQTIEMKNLQMVILIIICSLNRFHHNSGQTDAVIFLDFKLVSEYENASTSKAKTAHDSRDPFL